MPGIESELTKTVIESASKLLKKRTMGGVTTESATNAISNAAESVRTAANVQIGAAQREIGQLRREADLSATRIAELTSEKDAVVLQKEGLQSELETSKGVIEQLKAKLRAALGVKVGKPIELPNGNIRTVKTNKNGAVMTTEALPNGRKISVEVQTPNGIRKTTYDPVTGKPLKTYTDVNGSQIIEYDAEGAVKSIKKVNNKKVKPQKPTVVNREILSTRNGVITTRKTLSDGSYELAEIHEFSKKPKSGTLFNKDGVKVQETVYEYGRGFNRNITETITRKYDPKTNKELSIVTKNDLIVNEKVARSISSEQFYNPHGDVYKKVTVFENDGGIKQVVKADVDEFGIVNDLKPTMEYIYPKSSKIKSSKIEFSSIYGAEKETITLRDGTIVKFKLNNNYEPYDLTIKKKGSTEVTKITKWDEISRYVDSLGRIKVHDFRGNDITYHNSLRLMF